jgi:hypothetical protein
LIIPPSPVLIPCVIWYTIMTRYSRIINIEPAGQRLLTIVWDNSRLCWTEFLSKERCYGQ